MALLGLLALLINAIDYLFGVALLGASAAPVRLIPIGIALILVGAALMKQKMPAVP